MKKYFVLIVTLSIFVTCKRETAFLDTDKYLDFALQQVSRTLESNSDPYKSPRQIRHGDVTWSTVPLNDWTSGFWPGILWYMYEYSNDPYFREKANKWTLPMEGAKDRERPNHDLGFMVFNSFGNGYRLVKDPDYLPIILETADSLAAWFNPNVGTILSWPWARERFGWEHNTIIDNMMNLELLFWASKNGGDESYYDMAVTHALTTIRDHVRDDYSTYHVVVYDPLSGDVVKKLKHQGYADDSMWARGQAWAIYGFTMCYRETGIVDFLETAKGTARIFIDRLPDDYVPYWDFDAPNVPDEYRDASAAAIAASALIELSGLIDDTAESAWFYNMAIEILRSLAENYLSDGSNHAVLWHSTGHLPADAEIDVPIIYADYYFIEALLRERNIQNMIR